MIIGGDIGTVVDLSNVSKKLRSDFKLFSESNTRWILEAKKQSEKDFEETLKKEDVPFIKIGGTKGKKLIINEGKNTLINLDINTLRNIWKNAIWNIMG
jgi:phosphoribosylformylglycinamidine synthase